MQKKEVFILGTKKVGPFVNDEGKTVEGTQVHYVEKEPYSTDSQSGHVPSRLFLIPEKALEVEKYGQGFYNLLLNIELNGNKPRLKTEGFEFIRKAELNFK